MTLGPRTSRDKTMKLGAWLRSVKRMLERGVFPQELSFLLELPLRRLILSPAELVERLALTPASQVLEVGPGPGYYSVAVASAIPHGRLELLDLQPEMLERAKRKLQANGLRNVGYSQSSASTIPFPESFFDVVFLVAVLGEINNREEFLREAHRVIKPGGTLSISEHYPDPDFSALRAVKTLVEEYGFKLVNNHGKSWSYTANFGKSE